MRAKSSIRFFSRLRNMRFKTLWAWCKSTAHIWDASRGETRLGDLHTLCILENEECHLYELEKKRVTAVSSCVRVRREILKKFNFLVAPRYFFHFTREKNEWNFTWKERRKDECNLQPFWHSHQSFFFRKVEKSADDDYSISLATDPLWNSLLAFSNGNIKSVFVTVNKRNTPSNQRMSVHRPWYFSKFYVQELRKKCFRHRFASLWL